MPRKEKKVSNESVIHTLPQVVMLAASCYENASVCAKVYITLLFEELYRTWFLTLQFVYTVPLQKMHIGKSSGWLSAVLNLV